jgi:biopolymer transport protein ExbD
MKTPKYQARGSLEFNMTPMIDVTFLLIIFFIVSSNMAKQETQVELKLPTAASGDDPHDDARRVTVNLTADGALLVAGETLDAEMLGKKLAVERAKSDDLEVRLRCDRTVPYGRVKPVMRECLKNDVWKVTFAVVKEKY